MRVRYWLVVAAMLLSFTPPVQAQHLWWNFGSQRDTTCLYGQIIVLATSPAMYYCGANWKPGTPASGYCGIQENNNNPETRITIFSIWDTSDQLKTKVIGANCRTAFTRFAGEGTGGQSSRLWTWQLDQPFEFFVQKRKARQSDSTEARYFVFDPSKKKWQYVSTISSPNGGQKSVSTFDGQDGLCSFLENFGGLQPDAAKVALYRLWLGKSPDNMECLTEATGDGQWGSLHDSYFLAQGSAENLDKLFTDGAKKYGKPVFFGEGKTVNAITKRPIPTETLKALRKLPANELPQELLVNSPDYITEARRRENLIRNGSFESDSKAAWQAASYSGKGAMNVVKDETKVGNGALRIRATEYDDNRYIQTVSVKPNTPYLLSGWIKTKDVVIDPKGGTPGAYLWIVNLTTCAVITGTNDWTYVYVTFDSGTRKELEISPRLGFAKGAVWFDDLMLIELPEQSCVTANR